MSFALVVRFVDEPAGRAQASGRRASAEWSDELDGAREPGDGRSALGRVGQRGPAVEPSAAPARSSEGMSSARVALFLALVLTACGHNTGAREVAEAPEPAEPPQEESPEAVEAEVAATSAKPDPNAQVITFSGDDADPEPPTQIRSPPKRPPIPSFQLFGTRSSDGPR
jgi:hypothetical protein